MMVFDDDGKAMSIEEIIPHAKAEDNAWMTDPKRGGPYKLAMGPFGDSLDGYQQIVDQQMLFGFNAMPIVYSLRAGESFTRYLDPGLEDGKTFMFWGKDYYDLDGKPRARPVPQQTFLDGYPVGTGLQRRFRVHQANGVFEYNVPLADGKYKEGVKTEKDTTFADGALRGKTAEALRRVRTRQPLRHRRLAGRSAAIVSGTCWKTLCGRRRRQRHGRRARCR